MLAGEPELSRRELDREEKGKHIADALKDIFPGFSRRKHIHLTINSALRAGMLKENSIKPDGCKKYKNVLTVI